MSFVWAMALVEDLFVVMAISMMTHSICCMILMSHIYIQVPQCFACFTLLLACSYTSLNINVTEIIMNLGVVYTESTNFSYFVECYLFQLAKCHLNVFAPTIMI
jgi:hypothetical protein